MPHDPKCPEQGVVRERPILFSGEMVRAILDGRKTQTRRAIKLRADSIEPHDDYPGEWSPWKDGERQASILCPFGVPGDRLWVRETWQQIQRGRHRGQLAVVDQPMEGIGNLRYAADDPNETTPPKWRPSIHMPRWACRIVLELTDVRVHRLLDTTQADCVAEGCPGGPERDPTPRTEFRALWERINGAGSWDANPWVWALTFKRLTL